MLGFDFRPGLSILHRGFVPSMRYAFVVGGAITPRTTLHVELAGAQYLGLKTVGFAGDVVATRFFGRGLFLRGGLGALSHRPERADRMFRPAIGGLAGLGYEFDIADGKGIMLRLGADYDFRVRTDGLPTHAVTAGLGLVFLPRMRK
jgi:hypothetical protein